MSTALLAISSGLGDTCSNVFDELLYNHEHKLLTLAVNLSCGNYLKLFIEPSFPIILLIFLF